MKNLAICGLVLLLLALSCEAAEPIQLSGASGQSILMQIAGADAYQTTNATANTSGGLWNWGEIPRGYTLNATGQLTPVQQVLTNDFGGWVPNI